MEDIIGIPAEDAPEISAKNGINIHSVLEMIVKDIPAPKGDREAPLQALIFDSQYDAYRGVIVYTRIKEGTVRAGMDIRMMATGADLQGGGGGHHASYGPEPQGVSGSRRGGLHHRLHQNRVRYPGRRHRHRAWPTRPPSLCPATGRSSPWSIPVVYPADGAKYGDLRDALEKLKLNDASMQLRAGDAPLPWASASAAASWGCCIWRSSRSGWSGNTTWTSSPPPPALSTGCTKTDGTVLMVDNPLDYPDPMEIELAEEPFVKAQSHGAPQEYVGSIMDLCQNRRGESTRIWSIMDANRVELHYEMPLNEIIYDFFDALKSRTRGYGSPGLRP